MNNKKERSQGRNQKWTEIYEMNLERVIKNSSKLYFIVKKFDDENTFSN